VLHYLKLEGLAKEELSSSMDPFIRKVENKMLGLQQPIPVVNNYVKVV